MSGGRRWERLPPEMYLKKVSDKKEQWGLSGLGKWS